MNKTCASAVTAIGLMTFSVGTVLAEPNLSNNFTANITVTYLGKQKLTQQYVWHESHIAHLSRVDFANPLGIFKVLQLFPNTPLRTCIVEGSVLTIPTPTKNGIEYTYNTNHNACWRTSIPKSGIVLLPFPHYGDVGFWNGSAQATNSGTCKSHTGNNSGTLWTYRPDSTNMSSEYKEVGVCVASDNATPYWVSWIGSSKACLKQYPKDKGKPCTLVNIDFNSYTNGAPAIANFCPGSLAEARACGLR